MIHLNLNKAARDLRARFPGKEWIPMTEIADAVSELMPEMDEEHMTSAQVEAWYTRHEDHVEKLANLCDK